MRPQPTALALTLGLLGWLAPAGADEPTQGSNGSAQTLDALNSSFRDRFRDLEKTQIHDLAELAPKLKGREAEAAYHQLFQMAIARDAYEPVARAAEAYDGDNEELRGLATFVGAVHLVNQEKYADALARLKKFLGTQTADKKLDPNTTFAVGEALVQRFLRAGQYDDAARACEMLAHDEADEAIARHFATRKNRLALIGKPAPPLTGEDVDGQPVNLADARGKVVLVDFWATWCPPCVSQAASTRRLYDQFHDKGLEVIGVNVDPLRKGSGDGGDVSERVRDFLFRNRVSWPNLINGKGPHDFAKSFGVADLPTNFLIDRQGKIIEVEQGGPGLEKAVAEAVQAKPDTK